MTPARLVTGLITERGIARSAELALGDVPGRAAPVTRDVTDASTSPALREQVIATALAMNALGINRGKSGNVSARVDGFDGFVITPSGMPYDATRCRRTSSRCR